MSNTYTLLSIPVDIGRPSIDHLWWLCDNEEMSQLYEYPDQDEATIVGRSLVFVHKMIDENFPDMDNRSKQFTKTVLSGDEVTPVIKPSKPAPPPPVIAEKRKRPRQTPKKKNKKLISRPSSKQDQTEEFSNHGSPASNVSQYYEFPKKSNTFAIIISLTFLALAGVIAYILFL